MLDKEDVAVDVGQPRVTARRGRVELKNNRQVWGERSPGLFGPRESFQILGQQNFRGSAPISGIRFADILCSRVKSRGQDIGPLGQNGRHNGIDIGKAQAADGLGGLADDVNIGSKLFQARAE